MRIKNSFFFLSFSLTLALLLCACVTTIVRVFVCICLFVIFRFHFWSHFLQLFLVVGVVIHVHCRCVLFVCLSVNCFRFLMRLRNKNCLICSQWRKYKFFLRLSHFIEKKNKITSNKGQAILFTSIQVIWIF